MFAPTKKSRQMLLCLTFPPLLAAIAACGGGAGAAAGPAPAATSPRGSGGAAASPWAAASGPSASPPGPGSGASSGSSVDRCRTGDVGVSVAERRGGGGLGHFGRLLVFRNVSSRSCSMYGYPGVSFMGGGSGRQVNDPFVRSGGSPVSVTLAPDGLANVTLFFTQVGSFDPAQCVPVRVDGYRVYAPDEMAAVFVADPQEACSGKGVGVPEVGWVQPGATP
jgi:hypothetical protein